MASYDPPVGDIKFLLHRVLGIERLFGSDAYDGVDAALIDQVLDAAARFARDVVAPLNANADAQGCRIENGRVRMPDGYREAYAAYVGAGWPSLSLPARFGGQGMPLTLQAAVGEMVNGACMAFGMVPCATRAAATALIAAGEAWMHERVVPNLVSGAWSGTIVVTEPGAGSDVGRAVVKAAPRPDGTYAVSGTKIFISGGDHDLTEEIIHMVIARTPDAPPGVRGLSLFMVPSRRIGPDGRPGAVNAVRVARIERKMGLHGSPTCVLEFDGAEGFLVGAETQGINAIFHMINTMRLEVAGQGPAIAGAATARAFAYAAERVQGGAVIGEHPDVRRMLMTMKASTEGLRALVYEAALDLDLAVAAGDEEQRRQALDMAEWLLPICKSAGSYMGCEVASLAIQVHGGHGYVTDTGVEQYARDARIMPIYEGTNGIQAIDTLTRKLARDDGRRYAVFTDRIRADLALLGDGGGLEPVRKALAAGLTVLDDCTGRLTRTLGEHPRDALAGAAPYQALAARVATCWMWLRMAAADDGGARRAAARFYAERIMPDCGALAAQALAGSQTLFAVRLDALAPR